MFASWTPVLMYALETTVCSAVLWLFYKGVVSKTYHLGCARGYLLLLPIVSVLLPLLSIPVSWGGFWDSIWVEEAIRDVVVTASASDAAEASASAPSSLVWTWTNALAVGYLVGVLAFWLRIGWQCWAVGRLARSGRRERAGGPALVYSAKVGSPFSFLSTIYLPLQTDAAEKEIFIMHETEHIRRGHSFDVLFMEGIRSLFWFNPFFWKAGLALKDVHEYQVDRAVACGKLCLNTYKTMIMKELFGYTPAVSQGFGHSLVKKRILMLGKSGHVKNVLGRMSLLLPLLAGLMLLFCCKAKSPEPVVVEEPVVEAVIPAVQPEPVAAAEATASAGEEIVYIAVDEKPLFEGKEANAFTAWVNSRIIYPDAATERKAEGRVVLSFLIDKDGSLADIKITRSADPDLDKEALRVVSLSPKWTPGKQGGKIVKVRYSFSVSFQLQ